MNPRKQPAPPSAVIIAVYCQIARPVMRRFLKAASCIASARVTLDTLRLFKLHAVELPVLGNTRGSCASMQQKRKTKQQIEE
jgi:hypothetical protein